MALDCVVLFFFPVDLSFMAYCVRTRKSVGIFLHKHNGEAIYPVLIHCPILCSKKNKNSLSYSYNCFGIFHFVFCNGGLVLKDRDILRSFFFPSMYQRALSFYLSKGYQKRRSVTSSHLGIMGTSLDLLWWNWIS